MSASARLNAAAGTTAAALVLAATALLGTHVAGPAAPHHITADGTVAAPAPTETAAPDNHGWGG